MGPNLQFALRRAKETILDGGVVLHATEGVWGLACDAHNPYAVRRVLALKYRAVAKGLIVIGSTPEVFAPELEVLVEPERKQIHDSWPGAETWIVPNRQFSRWVTGGRGSVAIRVPGHDQARALCAEVGRPLVSTSANASGQPAPKTELAARKAMPSVDFVLPGRTAGRKSASRIRVAGADVVVRS